MVERPTGWLYRQGEQFLPAVGVQDADHLSSGSHLGLASNPPSVGAEGDRQAPAPARSKGLAVSGAKSPAAGGQFYGLDQLPGRAIKEPAPRAGRLKERHARAVGRPQRPDVA